MGPLGVPELIMIFIVALVVFGPKKLPDLGKSLGRGLREFNKAKNELKATWDEQIREADNQLQSTKETIQYPVQEAISAVNATPGDEPADESKGEQQPEQPHPGSIGGGPPQEPPPSSLSNGS